MSHKLNNMSLKTNTSVLDESLYSRQLYAIGKDTMTSIINSKVLIINLDPLAIEICKNIILCGVGSITIADFNRTLSHKDYGNYYITDKDFGKIRADILGSRLSELNHNVKINKYSGEITNNLLSKFNLVVFVDMKFDDLLLNSNEYCRSNNIKMICASSRGFMGYIFCDFNKFITTDVDGEKIKSGHIISHNNLTCTTDKYHDLQVGSKFKLTSSNNKINQNKIYEIKKIINLTSFETNISIDIDNDGNDGNDGNDDNDVGEYTEIKNSLEIEFKSLRESIKDPEFVFTDFSDFDLPNKLHKINCSILQNKLENLEINDPFTKKILTSYFGQLVPVNSIIGGLVANMIISGISNKYTPIKQWLYYECTNIVDLNNNNVDLNNNENVTFSDIYSNQIKVIGLELQKKLLDYKVFIVGSGAIGCEHLKNFSMMGIGSQVITDMDIIEKSNLNRQFLFRNSDIGKYKAEIACNKAKKMNPTINIEYKLNKVGIDTENIFTSDFYNNINCIINALDNVTARNYMDNQSITYSKPLLESGTLGLKGNVQVILPNLTESYQSMTDKTEDLIPVCTIKNFPYEISHCIQWAREQFESLFVVPFNVYNNLKSLSEEKLNDTLNKTLLNELVDIKNNLEYIKSNPFDMYKTFYNENYRQKIFDLINQYPEDYVTENGEKFWSGTKKFPKVIDFSQDNNICKNNIEAYMQIMNIIYFNENIYNMNNMNNMNNVNTELQNIISKSPTTSTTQKISETQETVDINHIKQFITNFINSTCYKFNKIEFEKDDDTNGHIKFISSSSNLRGLNYNINTVSDFETKGIAGKIIPALATTTSIVSGLVAIELYKLVSKQDYNLKQDYKLVDFKNTFLSLGTFFMGSSEPVECKYKKVGNLKISLWTTLEYNNISLEKLINTLDKDYNLNVDQIMYNDKSIYSMFMNENKKKEIINKKINELIELNGLSKCNLIVNISDKNDEDNEEIINILINYTT